MEALPWIHMALINRLIACMEYKGREGRQASSAVCCLAAFYLLCHELFLSVIPLSHATLPWSQPAMDWNLCKVWADINLSSLNFGCLVFLSWQCQKVTNRNLECRQWVFGGQSGNELKVYSTSQHYHPRNNLIKHGAVMDIQHPNCRGKVVEQVFLQEDM